MGEVCATITLENERDRILADAGQLGGAQVRCVEVDALVASLKMK